ncbi:hypothetical protein B0H14DRAFT_3468399 [Mycena olivaceomarginata]|nr:hypothetical protein B0H14DRAFT_3468399 [Mycena olivaceomarginata]
MHEVIRHDGIVLRLDAWRVEAKHRNPALNSLEDFAKSKPSLALLEDMANHLADSYVSGGEIDIYGLRSKSIARRDKQHVAAESQEWNQTEPDAAFRFKFLPLPQPNARFRTSCALSDDYEVSSALHSTIHSPSLSKRDKKLLVPQR